MPIVGGGIDRRPGKPCIGWQPKAVRRLLGWCETAVVLVRRSLSCSGPFPIRISVTCLPGVLT